MSIQGKFLVFTLSNIEHSINMNHIIKLTFNLDTNVITITTTDGASYTFSGPTDKLYQDIKKYINDKELDSKK
jgi:hypothetical protein